MVSDPVAGTNAHGHPRNLCSGLAGSQIMLQALPRCDRPVSFYATDRPVDVCCLDLGLPVDQLRYHTAQVLAYQLDDYTRMLSWLADQGVPVIYVAFDPAVQGYLWQSRTLDRKRFSAESARDHEDMEQEFQSMFFPDSQQPSEIWDTRERMALDLRPFDQPHYQDLTWSGRHHWINCQDLWFDTESAVTGAMAWLGIKVHTPRLESWRGQARSWQHIQNRSLKFSRELQQIVLCTVKGHYHEIPKLTLKQEAIIQHCLIYHHGLNLRTWQLDHFPNNTLDLHQLLEPNQHPLPL